MTSDKARLRRLPEREITDPQAIEAILDEAFVCHTAYVTSGRPVVLPMLYVRDGNSLILHGSKASGLAQAVKSGSALSVAITIVDGLVVARTGFHSSANYRSVVAHGHGTVLEGANHERALDLMVDRLLPGRLADIRRPTRAELRQTHAIELRLDDVSAKARSGGPHDDVEDLNTGVWAGVIPLEIMAGEPIPAEDLENGVPVPPYLNPYRRL
ncbi:MAG: pyridoxamine 5'-phosphate oxidase family protein [Acidimicrobiia bacterium]|nr:pyridoxamine 5'-phosphate oxidase family protein [Acidimicrobiia bacterium]